MGHVSVPASTNLGAQLFASDASYAHLTPGGWTTLQYSVPAGTSTPLYALGVQFLNSSATYSSVVLMPTALRSSYGLVNQHQRPVLLQIR
jgi:hypothetical protein